MAHCIRSDSFTSASAGRWITDIKNASGVASGPDPMASITSLTLNFLIPRSVVPAFLPAPTLLPPLAMSNPLMQPFARFDYNHYGLIVYPSELIPPDGLFYPF